MRRITIRGCCEVTSADWVGQEVEGCGGVVRCCLSCRWPWCCANGGVYAAPYANGYLNGGAIGNNLTRFDTVKGLVDWCIKGAFYTVSPAYADGAWHAPNANPAHVEERATADGKPLSVPAMAACTATSIATPICTVSGPEGVMSTVSPARSNPHGGIAPLVKRPRRQAWLSKSPGSARRGDDGSWIIAMSRAELIQAVHDNLRNLGVDVLEVVSLRSMFNVQHPAEGSLEEPLTVLAERQQQGLVRHIGLSNVTAIQIAQGRTICDIVSVQNFYNLAHRDDAALIDQLAQQGIAYVPLFPLGGFTPLQSTGLSEVADWRGATPMQVALAWLLQHSPNILLIPGTSSLAHLRENLAAGQLSLASDDLAQLDLLAV